MTLALQVSNNASGSLNAGIADTATSLSLKSGEGAKFPSASGSSYFYVTLQKQDGNWEIVKVTSKSSDTFSIDRNIDSSTGAAQAFSADDIVSLRPCANVTSDIINGLNNHSSDHDDRFFTEAEHINSSVGAGDAGKPVVLDSGGYIDASMINDADIKHSGLNDDEASKHREIDDTGLTSTDLWSAEKLQSLIIGQARRSQFAWKDADEIYIGSGQYEVDGKHARWASQLTKQLVSPLANTWYYLYLDYSAITSGTLLTATEFIFSATAPTWNEAKCGWYNGSDRCIFAVLTDGSGNIIEFYHDGDFIYFADHLACGQATKFDYNYINVTVNATWDDVYLPAPNFCSRSVVTFTMDPDTTSASDVLWRKNSQTGSIGHRAISGRTGGSHVPTLSNQISVISDTSQIIEVKDNAATTNEVDIYLDGWFFPVGM